MKKYLFLLVLLAVLFCIPNTYALDANNYRYKSLCGTYEVTSLKVDGSIEAKGCFGTYGEAKASMTSLGTEDLVVMTKVNGETAIVDANVALLDLTVNPEALTYYYTNSDLSGSAYTYMDNSYSYGGVDGLHVDSTYSSRSGWVAKVQIANFTGWIKKSAYEIVPITWVRSASHYVVTSDGIRHNYITRTQNDYTSSTGRTIGPKPDMLPEGTYYSYDGHYFYNNLTTLIRDVKNNTHNNAINKSKPYYNYYMYLSNHTKTAYSSININEYIRNNLGLTRNVYGNAASAGTSRLYGMGSFFYHAQEKYGVNAILSLSLSRNETGNGRSNLAINKNNGFGLNAVDSNPTQAANWYASFSSSILGYASKWITYGYAHPRDWRYYGPQFGDKWIGMNVKYASDTYWSEKMAANYYSLDKAFGLQDYDNYQLGVVNGRINSYLSPSYSSKVPYLYTEKEDTVVIVGEVEKNNEKWYKVVSDLNMDSNGNEITSGPYNWNSYVYLPTSQVTKINTAKNGYLNPNDIIEYEDKDYEYDLYIENTELKPKVAITTKDTPYYYESTLSTKTGSTLLKNRYVMVYTAAYQNGVPVSYLVTSDYWHDQKEWVSADSIRFVTSAYGKAKVEVEGNQYTWVNYNTEDASYSIIGGLFTNTYVPILEVLDVNGVIWYKVPVNLTGNDNQYGYTLASFPGVSISTYQFNSGNNKPVIVAKDKTIMEQDSFDPKKDVAASDAEDGDLTSKIEITENTVNTSTPGVYKVTYKVKDSANNEVSKTIKVTVKGNAAPVITASDKTIFIGDTFNPLDNVSATDQEDGDLTNKLKVTTNTVKTDTKGTYKVIYEVVDSKNKKTTKEITVTVKEKLVINYNQSIEDLIRKGEKGEFYLNRIEWDPSQSAFIVEGYCIILNTNNEDKEYSLLFVDKDTRQINNFTVTPWIKDTPYDVGKENGYSYTNSWFKKAIDFSMLNNGDYEVYLLAQTNEKYTVQVVNNFLNKKLTRRGEDNLHGYNFKVQQRTRIKEVELSVRDKNITTAEAPTNRNMVNGYDEIKWVDNKLYIYGYSYDYQGIYNDPSKITRKLILENQRTYEQTVIDVGSTKGPFTLTTLDKKDKTYAWYEKTIDVSNLEQGKYTLLVYTKTSNAENYDEIPDMLKSLSLSTIINKKIYRIYCNKNKKNRIELIIQ